MLPLLKIRAERDQMSAIERRIADFILAEAHLLRDYSSQQLADALKVSQSSVIKFSQKLGFKGYPDLKYSIGESIARGDGGDGNASARPATTDRPAALAESLWHAKTQAEQETRLINPSTTMDAIAAVIAAAPKTFLIGLGQDGIPARAFAVRLSLLGIVAVHHFDGALMTAGIATATADDLLLVFSEHGQQPGLCQIARQFRARGGTVVSATRHTANALRAFGDLSLVVSAHDERAHIEPLLYQSALQHLLDTIVVLLCDRSEACRTQLEANLEGIRNVLEA